ncbi:MAG: hypothetical protein HY233_11240 [Acidobacteriales bacterium]|nr:hypothetical protein [Candidatus Koribacter versatilis]MBI3646524.1 hypothetical protein [Terriglobales bacterium]
MKSAIKNMFLAATLAALAVPVTAQNTVAPAHPKAVAHKPTVQQRKQHQQKRIAHGIQSGKLTAGEAASLEKKEAGLNAEERDMREDNRGRLTAANRAKLHHQQNQVSKAIYRGKHNAAAAKTHPKTVAGQRAQNQQPRAAAGLKTGHLTSREAAHLQTKQASFNRQVHRDHQENGGKLTSAEPAQANQQQNKTSNQIRLKKHNARMF